MPVHATTTMSSTTADIKYETIGRYFCGTLDSSMDDCWYSNRFYMNGKLFTISNPKKHFSVLEPAGGCGTATPVSTTAQAFGNQTFLGGKPGCRVAVNAGFFTRNVHVIVNTTTNKTKEVLCGTRDDAPCECLGNLISQQKIIQTTSLRNVNFGLRNGSFVVGYLSEDEVRSAASPFEQLIAGVVWLVRNGTNYVDIAAAMEDPTTQQTSDVLENPNNHRANTFVDVFAARTVIGHDREGRLKIFQLDGLHGRDRPTRGIGLRSLANILIDLGFYNAVNLDGGGSSTVVQDDRMVNYPSDLCPNSMPTKSVRCERPVSSIVCIHDAIVSPSAPSSENVPSPTSSTSTSSSSSSSSSSSPSMPSMPSSTTPSMKKKKEEGESAAASSTIVLSLLLCASMSMHLGVWYVAGYQGRDVRNVCRDRKWKICNHLCCSPIVMMKTKQPKYSKVEKQHLRSVEAMSEEVEDGINSKEIELGDWEEND